jgi:hypothetical protein
MSGQRALWSFRVYPARRDHGGVRILVTGHRGHFLVSCCEAPGAASGMPAGNSVPAAHGTGLAVVCGVRAAKGHGRQDLSHVSWRTCGLAAEKSATGVAGHRPGERETIGSVATRALTGDSAEMEFLTGDPVAQAVTCQRVMLDARAPRCGRYGCATAGRVNWT